MGALTGNTKAATYQALLKFSDNLAVTSSLKDVEDGLGNVLPIKISTTLVHFTSNVGIKTLNPATDFHVASTSTSSPRGIMSSQHNNGNDGARFHLRKSRGTNAAPTIIVTGDNLGRWVASGYDGTSYLEMGSVIMGTEGTIGTGRIPTNLQFYTATDAATSVLTERARIDSAGNFALGTTTPTAWFHNATNGAASRSSMWGSGTIFTGGDGTTTFPYWLIQPTGTTSTSWSTSGTYFGINTASGFGGRIVDFKTNNTSRFFITSGGEVNAPDLYSVNGIIVGNIGYMSFNGRLVMKSSSNGRLAIYNNAENSFDLLQFGGVTASFPAWKRNAATLEARLADDSGFTAMQSLYERFGSGSPEGVITAPIGATYHRTDGGASTSNYFKESGTGNTGWVAK